jgi:RimJ/RimL family protein N-acetyltransferase
VNTPSQEVALHGVPHFTGIETERLILRRLTPADLPTLLAYRNDPLVAEYQSWTSMSQREGELFIAEMQTLEPGMRNEWFQFAIERKSDGAHIGDCALHTLDDTRQGEIGYTLARAEQGQGYAREAVAAMVEYAFAVLKMHRISATADVENAPSYRLLEALGFRREGTVIEAGWFHGRWCSEHLYAMLAREWRIPTG